MTLLRQNRSLAASIVALGVLYAAGLVRYAQHGFGSPLMLAGLLGDNAVLGIVAVGMTIVILSGGIDLSVGAVMSFSSILTGVMIMRHGWSPPAAYLAALVVATAMGLCMGVVIHATGLRPFVVTLAGMFLARGLGFLIHLDPSIAIDHPLHRAISWWPESLRTHFGLRITAVLFLGVLAVAMYVASLRPFGRAVFALGGDEESAALMGLPVARTKVLVYGVSGFCAGLAGVALTLYLSSGSHVEGVGLELDAIAAVVIGGTLLTGGVGSVAGTLVGVLMIGLMLSIMTYENLSSGLTKLAIGGLMLVFVLVQRAIAPRASVT